MQRVRRTRNYRKCHAAGKRHVWLFPLFSANPAELISSRLHAASIIICTNNFLCREIFSPITDLFYRKLDGMGQFDVPSNYEHFGGLVKRKGTFLWTIKRNIKREKKEGSHLTWRYRFTQLSFTLPIGVRDSSQTGISCKRQKKFENKQYSLGIDDRTFWFSWKLWK